MVPDSPKSKDNDFAKQMRALAHEAERSLDERPGKKAQPGVLQMLRPLVVGIEALSRATAANTQALARLEEAAGAHSNLPDLMNTIQGDLEKKGIVNQKMFDALHEELKGYKDVFMFEVLQKPIIKDMITVFDDVSEITRQIKGFTEALERAAPATDQLVMDHVKQIGRSVEHIAESLVEVMARFDVMRMESSKGQIDKQKHRAVAVELAENPEDDGTIASTVKPGFIWRDRLLRPEEVVVKKFKDGFLVAMDSEDQ